VTSEYFLLLFLMFYYFILSLILEATKFAASVFVDNFFTCFGIMENNDKHMFLRLLLAKHSISAESRLLPCVVVLHCNG